MVNKQDFKEMFKIILSILKDPTVIKEILFILSPINQEEQVSSKLSVTVRIICNSALSVIQSLCLSTTQFN